MERCHLSLLFQRGHTVMAVILEKSTQLQVFPVGMAWLYVFLAARAYLWASLASTAKIYPFQDLNLMVTSHYDSIHGPKHLD